VSYLGLDEWTYLMFIVAHPIDKHCGLAEKMMELYHFAVSD
jgi:hypothetical protein